MIVEARGLTKRFPVRRTWQESVRAPFAAPMTTVLHEVSFSVARGEIFGLLGQNGAGKTTLFKLLATLITPDTGSATVDGHDIARDARQIRDILAPVLANERSLYWRLSARENLRLYATLQGLHGAAAGAEIARVLEVTGLSDTGQKMVGMFSSGMRQRLLIARALLARPRLLLLDEPTRSLDPISARDLRAFLRDVVVRQEGCTILLATHDADEVWELCDRVGVLERGHLLAVDRTSVLRERAGAAAYDVWLRAQDAAARAARAAAIGVPLHCVGPAPDEGWEIWRGEIPGGASEAAAVLAALNAAVPGGEANNTAAGAGVARFERVLPSLANLIERVVANA